MKRVTFTKATLIYDTLNTWMRNQLITNWYDEREREREAHTSKHARKTWCLKKIGRGKKKDKIYKRHDASAHFNIHYHPPSRNNIDNNNNVCLPFRSHIIPFNLFVLSTYNMYLRIFGIVYTHFFRLSVTNWFLFLFFFSSISKI